MEKDFIITRDLYIAAILVAYDIAICHVDKTDPKRQFFYFQSLPEQVWIKDGEGVIRTPIGSLDDLKALYSSKKLFFPPSFVDSLRSVRSYLFVE